MDRPERASPPLDSDPSEFGTPGSGDVGHGEARRDDLGHWAYRPARPLRGRPDGPLSGLQFSAKDLYGVSGWPLRGGTRALLPPVGESELVRRVLDGGADLVGTTQLHEVALGVTGVNAFGGTRNPLGPDRVAGGSSGGAAVSVATGEVDFALGTDTGGSVRVPAALCGVVGFKPTYGTYPLTGALPLSATCDHAGTLARSVDLLARVHEVVTGEAPRSDAPVPLRVGVWDVRSWVTPTAWSAVEIAAAHLTSLGASVEAFSFPDVLDTYTPIVLSEAAAVHAAELRRPVPGFTAATLALLLRGAAITPDEVSAARERREALRDRLTALLDRFDLLLAPAVPDVAPRVGQDELTLPGDTVPVRTAILRLTAPWSLLGVPTLTLPRRTPDLSVGVQLVGRPGHDTALLALGGRLAPTGLLQEIPS